MSPEEVRAYLSQVAAAVDHSQVLQELDAISVDQPLATRLVEVLDALDAYHDRVHANIQALLHSSGTAGEPRWVSGESLRGAERVPEVHRAVARLFEPDREHLRRPSDDLAEVFLALTAVRTSNVQRSAWPAGQLVDLFLHGVVTVTP
jgi:hypothetical protein